MSNRILSRNLNKSSRSRRKRRAGWGASLLNVHQRAQIQVNLRGDRRRRGMTRQAAIADTARASDLYEDELLRLPLTRRILHWGLGILLMPLCFITAITLMKESGEERIFSDDLVFHRTSLLYRRNRLDDQLVYRRDRQ